MATRKRPTKKKAKGRDENELAASIVALVTEAAEAKPEKNPAAVALGRRGGLKGGKARAEKLSSEERTEIAKRAARARWGKGDR